MNKYVAIFAVASGVCCAKTNGVVNAAVGGLFSVGKFQSYNNIEPKENKSINAKAFLGEVGAGIATQQNWMYGEATLNLTCAPLNKDIYSNNITGQNQVKLTQLLGMGLNAKVGAQLPIGVIPFASLGVEIMPQTMTYSSINLSKDQVLRNNSPSYCFGFGFKTPISHNVSLNVETQYRYKKTFEMLKVMQSDGSPSLSGRRVKVSADQVAVKVGLSYNF